LATDADSRDVDCFAFYRDRRRVPTCNALKHPYCLTAGASPESCRFHKPRAEYEAEQAALAERRDKRKKEKEAEALDGAGG
jgi:hypothetical protein